MSEAMRFYRELLEATHNCLGELNFQAGRYMEAMDHLTLALNIIENSMNTNELDIFNTNYDLGVVYYHLGHFKKATTVLEGACSIQREVLGIYHNSVAKTMYHVAIIKRIPHYIEQSLHLLNEQSRSTVTKDLRNN